MRFNVRYWLSRQGREVAGELIRLGLSYGRIRAETWLWRLRGWRLLFMMKWFDPWFYPRWFRARYLLRLEADHLWLTAHFFWVDLHIGWLRAQNFWLRARLRFMQWQLGIGEFDPTVCLHCQHALAVHRPRCTVAGCACRRQPPRTGTGPPSILSRGPHG